MTATYDNILQVGCGALISNSLLACGEHVRFVESDRMIRLIVAVYQAIISVTEARTKIEAGLHSRERGLGLSRNLLHHSLALHVTYTQLHQRLPVFLVQEILIEVWHHCINKFVLKRGA